MKLKHMKMCRSAIRQCYRLPYTYPHWLLPPPQLIVKDYSAFRNVHVKRGK